MTDAIAFAPTEALTAEQARFLWLHQRFAVSKWHWLLNGAQLRAFTPDGRTATISHSELAALADAGFIECFEPAGVKLTKKGKALK
jgi:hypothetical protein